MSGTVKPHPGQVEALAKHLYLTTDEDWDHRAVPWHRLDEETQWRGRAYYRRLARTYARIVLNAPTPTETG